MPDLVVTAPEAGEIKLAQCGKYRHSIPALDELEYEAVGDPELSVELVDEFCELLEEELEDTSHKSLPPIGGPFVLEQSGFICSLGQNSDKPISKFMPNPPQFSKDK